MHFSQIGLWHCEQWIDALTVGWLLQLLIPIDRALLLEAAQRARERGQVVLLLERRDHLDDSLRRARADRGNGGVEELLAHEALGLVVVAARPARRDLARRVGLRAVVRAHRHARAEEG